MIVGAVSGLLKREGAALLGQQGELIIWVFFFFSMRGHMFFCVGYLERKIWENIFELLIYFCPSCASPLSLFFFPLNRKKIILL